MRYTEERYDWERDNYREQKQVVAKKKKSEEGGGKGGYWISREQCMLRWGVRHTEDLDLSHAKI